MKELRAPSLKSTVVDDSYTSELVFWLNGEKVVIAHPDPTIALADYLHSIGLTGTKVGCGQGGCGACTVMLSHRDMSSGQPVHRAVNSCIRPLCAVDEPSIMGHGIHSSSPRKPRESCTLDT